MRKRVLDKGWRDFDAWCARRRVKALPAHPWTVAAYLRWRESRYRSPDIESAVKAIARGHLLNSAQSPDRHPTVKRTIRMIEARAHTRSNRAALFLDEDFVEGGAAHSKGTARRPGGQEPQPKDTNKRRTRIMNVTPRLVPRRPSGS
ncbi:MAG: hypothetical protein V3R66_08035 [Rhodospirillales bacterium]